MVALGSLWDKATAVAEPGSGLVVLAAAAVALVLVGSRAGWGLTRHVVTIVHEGAHGFVALASGRRLAGIRLHSDTSGLTVSSGRPRGPGMVATAFAGYVGPTVLGVGAALLLDAGRAAALLWGLLAALALLLVQIRNWFGLWSVLVTGGVLVALTWFAPVQAQSFAAYVVTWGLLLAAPRPVLELQALRRRGARGSDADVLAKITPLPALAWVGAFLLVTLGGLALGGWLLLT